MEPALIATEALSKDSINIIDGEFIAETLVNQTSKLGSPIGKRFHNVVIERINFRRNTAVVSLALYLLNQDSLSKAAVSTYQFKMDSKSATYQFGTKLLTQLFASEDKVMPDDEDDLEMEKDSQDSVNLTLQEKMSRAIEERWGKGKANQAENPSTQTSAVQKKFSFIRQRSPKGTLARETASCFVQHPTNFDSK